MGAVIINTSDSSLGLTAQGIYGTTLLTGHGYTVVGGVQFGSVYSLKRIEDAEAIGITQAADIAAGMLVWYHLDEFFRMAPGSQVYLIVFDPTVTATNTLVKLLNKTSGPLPAIFNQIKGAALLVGVWRNLTSATQVNGIDDDVFAAIPVAQDLAEAQRQLNQPIDIFIEGQKLQVASSAATSLRTNLASWVGLTIAQDQDVAAWHANFAGYAAVGTAVGVKAAARTSRNIGYVAECNIQDTGIPRWVNPGLSSGVPISALSTDPVSGDYVTWLAKGYIVPRVYNAPSAPGVYFDNDPTCDALTSTYNRLANAHTYNKAHRLIFNGVAPLINWDVDVDPVSGQLTPEVCAVYESAGNDQLLQMKQLVEISGFQTKCDPNQNVEETGEIVVGFEIVPKGNAGNIVGNIYFVKALTPLT